MRFQRIVAEIVAATAVAVVVAGCSSSPEPTPLPEPTLSSAGSSSSSPSPSITPPTLPPAAKGTSSKAAKAFARYYIDLVSYAMVTGETSALREAGTDECVSCDAIAGNIEDIYASGGHIKSDGWRVTNVRIVQSSQKRSVLSLGVHLNDEVVIKADGERERHEGAEQPMTMRLRHGDQTFEVTRLDFVT